MSKPCSRESQERVQAFEQADALYKREWEKFEDTHSAELQQLERLREDRNAKLDEARRSLRAELELDDGMRTTIGAGRFTAQKRWSDFYIPEKLASMLAERGLYDSALTSKIMTVRIETERYEVVKQFLEEHGLVKEFECCEDGAEAHSAISGPKSVPPFGAELKKE